MKQVRITVGCLLLISLGVTAFGQDRSTLVRSLVFPGMGQLSEGNTVKGLAFMGAEVLCISLAVGQFAQAGAYAGETEYLSIQYKTATSYEEKKQKDAFWRDAAGEADKRKMLGIAFTGAAAAVWGLNVLDISLWGADDESRTATGAGPEVYVIAPPYADMAIGLRMPF